MLVQGVSLLEIPEEIGMQDIQSLVDRIYLIDFMLILEPQCYFHVVGHFYLPKFTLELLLFLGQLS